MFDRSYPYNKVNIERPIQERYLICTHNYTFKVDKTPYIAQVERYPNQIYIIKFFRKQDRKSKDRYHVKANEFKCTRIVATCIHILISILKRDENASFGFLGSNTITNDYEEPINETRRFRIYKRAMENLVGDHVFEHSMDLLNSTYLMVNRRNPSIDKFIDDAKSMFDEIFPDLAY